MGKFFSDKHNMKTYASGLYSLLCTLMVSFFALQPIYAGFSPGKYGSIFKDMALIEIYTLIACGVLYFLYAMISDTDVSLVKRPYNVLKKLLSKVFSGGYSLLLALVYILAVVSYFVAAQDKTRALTGTEFRPDGLLMYTAFAALFIFASGIKKAYYKRFVYTLYMTVFVIVSLIMVQQYFGIIGTASTYECGDFGNLIKAFYDRLGIRIGHFYKGFTGVFYNSNHMGYYILICSMICTGRFVSCSGAVRRVAYGLLTAYSYWVLIINNTFGCYLAALGALIVFAFVIRKKFRKPVLAAAVPLIIFAVVTLTVTYSAGIDNQESVVETNFTVLKRDVVKIVTDNTDTPKGEPTVGSGRWSLWVASEDIIREEPIFGFGPDNLKPEYSKRDAKLDRAHNEFLEIAVSIGLPAAILYIGAFLAAFIFGIRKLSITGNQEAVVPLIAVVAYGISALFGVFLFYTACHCFIMMGLIE